MSRKQEHTSSGGFWSKPAYIYCEQLEIVDTHKNHKDLIYIKQFIFFSKSKNQTKINSFKFFTTDWQEWDRLNNLNASFFYLILFLIKSFIQGGSL